VSEPIEYRLKMTSEHRGALTRALEIVARAGMGQFRELADMFTPQDGVTMDDHGQRFERVAKDLLTPELWGGAYHGIRNDKTPMTSKLAWELLEAMTNPPNRCEGLSGQPLPTLEVIE
jgi:hypothetical protein